MKNTRARHEASELWPAMGVKAFITAFSLVELLVVMAIISLLAAMLLPVLAHANMVAKQASCLNNLKQIGIAVFLYADDNQNRLPEHGYNLPQISVNRGYAWSPKKSVGWWLLAGRRYVTPGVDLQETPSYTGKGDKLWRCPGRKHLSSWPGYWPNIREIADYAQGWTEGMPEISPSLNKFPTTKFQTCMGGPWVSVDKRQLLYADAVDPGGALSGPFYDIPHLQNANVLAVDGAGHMLAHGFAPEVMLTLHPPRTNCGNTFLYLWEAGYGAGWWVWAEKKVQRK